MEAVLKNTETQSQENPIVYLDVSVGDENGGRIVLELYKNVAPKTVENFRALCTGEKGIGLNGKPLHYKGSYFHKVVPQCMIQGGDIVNFDGSGGESIYGHDFEDESFEQKNTEAGCLVMVNKGRQNTNSSQFVITSVPCPHLDETNVVFGKVIKGIGVVSQLNEVETVKDKPLEIIRIVDCGEFKSGESWGLAANDCTEDVYPAWPEDWDQDSIAEKLDITNVEIITNKIKNSGNHYFYHKDYKTAENKYKKALRYVDWMVGMNNSNNDNSSESKIVDLKVTILSNLAAVKLKRQQFREALKICNKILDMDETNCKAMYRRGLAHMGLNEYQLALADLKQALTEMPNNREIIREMDKVDKIIQSYLVYEKKTCQRMFK